MHILLFFLSILANNLGHQNYTTREIAECWLSNPFGALYLWMQSPSDNVEARERAIRIKRTYGWFFSLEIIEARTFVRDKETWFWLYAFEGKNRAFTDREIRYMFSYDAEMYPILEDVINLKYVPYWANVYESFVPPPAGMVGKWKKRKVMSHLSGALEDGEVLLMRRGFTMFNKKGQAYRGLIGGMFGLEPE
jgi:hypothetical protein